MLKIHEHLSKDGKTTNGITEDKPINGERLRLHREQYKKAASSKAININKAGWGLLYLAVTALKPIVKKLQQFSEYLER